MPEFGDWGLSFMHFDLHPPSNVMWCDAWECPVLWYEFRYKSPAHLHDWLRPPCSPRGWHGGGVWGLRARGVREWWPRGVRGRETGDDRSVE